MDFSKIKLKYLGPFGKGQPRDLLNILFLNWKKQGKNDHPAMRRSYLGAFGGSPNGKQFLFIESMVKYQALS